MTVGELKKKLEMYRDDAEIFIGKWDDLHKDVTYYSPSINQTEVDVLKTKKGYEVYSNLGLRGKKHTILVLE